MITLNERSTKCVWEVDFAHSEVKFKVRHLVISHVTGHFRKFNIKVDSSKEDFTDAKIYVEADVNSVDTNDSHRDRHLKSPDFFDAKTYPKIKFVSKSLTRISENKYLLIGDITIRNNTREITLDVNYNGSAKSFGNIQVAVFEITGKLSRTDFDLKWNALTEVGTVVAGDEVIIDITIELKKHSIKT